MINVQIQIIFAYTQSYLLTEQIYILYYKYNQKEEFYGKKVRYTKYYYCNFDNNYWNYGI